ncbi:major facilitator superfamily domain-containing protein [Absidia repens]|uniref:Major facilitator superfamily domain-containing protein n=1 Tax=Absidia repens TaxID=90262 RepID=A0A1X2IGW3_9FUNG|nr:major facilitator superfamily domain-containing protein [Absidia repens]
MFDEKKIKSSSDDMNSISTGEPHYEGSENVVYESDPFVEKKLLRKLDFWSNIGNAKLGSFEKDLHLEGNGFYQALMVFYIGNKSYASSIVSKFLFEPLSRRLSALSNSIKFGIETGVCSTSIAGTTNLAGVIAARFFLGCSEAGLGPCVPLLLSFWYKRDEMASRVSIFISASTLAGSFGGIWAYLIMDYLDQVEGLASWRWMFIIEGVPTILLGILCLLFLPNYPETASKRWLTPDEKRLAIQRGNAEGKGNNGDGLDWRQVSVALLDYKTWMISFINGAAVLCHASFSIFLPTLVKAMGFQALQAQLLSAPPYVVGCIVLLVSTAHYEMEDKETCASKLSDRINQRGIVILGCTITTVIGYTCLVIGEYIPLQYTGVILVACGINATIALGISWLSNNQFGSTRRGVSLSASNMIAQVFGLAATQIYRDSDGPTYRIGHTVCLTFSFLAIFMTLFLRYLLAQENKRRDELYGPVEKKETVVNDSEDDGSTRFRYIL